MVKKVLDNNVEMKVPERNDNCSYYIPSKKLVIIGFSAGGIELVEYVQQINCTDKEWEIVGFIDEKIKEGEYKNNKILGSWEWLDKNDPSDLYFICSIGDPEIKSRAVARLKNDYNAKFSSIIHPTAVLPDNVSIGEGSIIAPYSILQPHAKIGNHVFCGGGVYIGHDATINDFVTLNPGTIISGNVVVDSMAYFGTGSKVLQNIKIGYHSVVSAGSTVFNDVPDNTSVIGVPARTFFKKK